MTHQALATANELNKAKNNPKENIMFWTDLKHVAVILQIEFFVLKSLRRYWTHLNLISKIMEKKS